MLRIGIIGAGGISAAHIRGYLEFPEDCEIVAVADISPEKAQGRIEEFGLTAAVAFGDPAALIAAGGIDLVSIVTPPSTHRELSIAALQAGIHVVVEKPMAPSLEDCDAMIAAERASGKILSVVAQNRFRDDLATLKEALESGLIGSISHLRIDSSWWRGLSYYDLWWRGTWESEGGGCTLNHAIHHIDLMLWLMGRPTEITAMLSNAQHDNAEVEDLSVAVMRFGRALGQLTSSVVSHGEEQEIVIHGERARISQPWRVVAETARDNGFPLPGGNPGLVAELDALAAAHTPLTHTGHGGQLGEVMAAIREGRPASPGSEDGRNAIEIVTAIYESAIERRVVDLPLTPEDPYYRAGALVERAPRFYQKTSSVRDFGGEIVVGSSAR